MINYNKMIKIIFYLKKYISLSIYCIIITYYFNMMQGKENLIKFVFLNLTFE